MNWARPDLAWWLLALVPLVLLHLHHRRRRTATVHGVWLWEGLAPRGRGSRGLRRLRDVPTLLLLGAVLALIVGAGAEPFSGAAPGPRARWTLIVDTSLSMRAVEPDGVPRLELARGLARRVLARAAPGDEFTLWRAGSDGRLVVAPTTDAGRVETALEALTAGWSEGGLRRTVELAESVVGEPGVPEEHVIVVLTDADGVTRLAGLPDLVPSLRVLRVGPTSTRNAGLRLRDAREPEDGLELVLRTTDGPPTPRRVRVERLDGAGGRETLAELLLQPDASGSATERVEVADSGGVVLATLDPRDAFPLDDTAAWALPDRRALRVAVVHESGNPSPFLIEALRAMPDVVDSERALLVGTEVPAAELAGVDVLIVDGSPPAYVPPGLPRLVFRARGTPRVTDPLPWGVGDHPVLVGVDLSPLRLEQAVLLESDAEERVLLRVGDGVIATTREDGPRAIVLGFAPDSTTLPLEAAFPVLLRNSLRWLARRPPHVPELVAGEPIVAAAALASEIDAVRFDVPGEPRRLLPRGTGRLPAVPAPVDGLPRPVRLGLGGTTVQTVWTWHPPPDLRLGSDSGTTVDESAPDDLPLRSGIRDTRRSWAPWFALLAALLLTLGAVIGAVRRGATANVDSVGGDF